MPKFDSTLCPSCNQGLKGAEGPLDWLEQGRWDSVTAHFEGLLAHKPASALE